MTVSAGVGLLHSPVVEITPLPSLGSLVTQSGRSSRCSQQSASCQVAGGEMELDK